ALCMALARRVGIAAAAVTTGAAEGRPYLLVERYDRRFSNGRWRRIHQEDFCQLLGKPPSAKYERNRTGIKGPSLADMFGAIDRYLAASDRIGLLDAVIFNVLICNTDSHAKNYSVLVGAGGSARLAPLYDLMCAAAWENVTPNLPQLVAGRDRGDHLAGRHWQRLAAQ